MKLAPYILLGIASTATAQDTDFKTWVTARAIAVSGVTDDSIEELPRHAHDPAEEHYLQSLEIGINFEAFGWLSGFANVNTFHTDDLELESEQEEWFLKAANLPYGIEFRGGQFLNRIGTQNSVHQHGWNYIDASLSTIHFLGEEGLTTRSGEVSFFQEFDSGLFGFSAALGQTAPHDHDHGHEEEGEEEEHHDEDHDELEDDHGHEGIEIAEFDGEVFTLRGLLRYNFTDFHQNQIGLNYLRAEGEEGGDADLWGVDYTYTWRENGLEGGGDSFTASLEYYNFSNDEADLNSFLVDARYQFANGVGVGARYESVDYLYEEEEQNRQRLALIASYQYEFNEDWSGRARLQYNNNNSDIGDGDEVWVQVGFTYGGAEIR